MAETPKLLAMPTSQWKTLKTLIKAWYTTAESGQEVTQNAIAEVAGVYPSRLSANKPFFQAIGILDADGRLSENGKLLGLGLTNENESVARQALEAIVRSNPTLKQLADVIRGRGPTDHQGFETQVTITTKLGKNTNYFGTGVDVMQDILVESGLVVLDGDKIRASREGMRDEPKSFQAAESKREIPSENGLKRIPIPVSPQSVWFVEVQESASQTDIENFLNVQKMIFGIK